MFKTVDSVGNTIEIHQNLMSAALQWCGSPSGVAVLESRFGIWEEVPTCELAKELEVYRININGIFNAHFNYTVQEFTRNKPSAKNTRFFLFCMQALGHTFLRDGEWFGRASDGTIVLLCDDYSLKSGAFSTYLHTHPLPEHW